MIEIPKQLQKKEFNFVMCNGKRPFQKDWQKKNVKYNDGNLLRHLDNNGNYGVICGGEKKLVVVDLDDNETMEEIKSKLPKTFTILTGSGKYHLYYYSNGLKKYKIMKENLNTIADIQAEGTQVIAPNSIHPDTKKAYSIHEDNEISFIDYEKLKNILMPYHKKKNKENYQQKIKSYQKSNLSEKITRYVKVEDILRDLGINTNKNPTDCPFHSSKGGKCFSYTNEKWNCFHCNESGNIFSLIQKAKNINSKESLKYLSKIAGIEDEFNENKRYETIKKTNQNNRTKFDDYFNCFNEIVEDLFLNQTNEPYVSLRIKEHLEHRIIESEYVKNKILVKCFQDGLGAPSKEVISQIIGSLKAMALASEKKNQVNLRFAYKNNKIYIDLIRDDWKILEISKNEINLIDSEDVIFERFNHMKEIEYNKESKIEDINLYASDFEMIESDKLMQKVELVTSFLPTISRTICQISGSMGSGKSIYSKQFRSICDPSELETLIFPESEQELLLQSRQNAILVYDNMRHVNNRFSDLMCSISTGASISQRKLYTDSDTIISKIKRKLVLNGINRTGNNSDFGDRSLELNLKRIKSSKRKTESEIWNDFNKNKSLIQGACFKILQKALSIKNEISIKELPRMADYCIWGESISRVLGKSNGFFTKAYFEKINNLSEEILEGNNIAKSIIIFADRKKNWEGTSTDLYKEVTSIAESILKIDIKYSTEWIKSSVVLSKKIAEFEPLLENKGISISKRKSNGMRLIKIVSSNNELNLFNLKQKVKIILKESPSETFNFNYLFETLSINGYKTTEEKLKEYLKELKTEGIIFEPKEGYFQYLK